RLRQHLVDPAKRLQYRTPVLVGQEGRLVPALGALIRRQPHHEPVTNRARTAPPGALPGLEERESPTGDHCFHLPSAFHGNGLPTSPSPASCLVFATTRAAFLSST